MIDSNTIIKLFAMGLVTLALTGIITLPTLIFFGHFERENEKTKIMNDIIEDMGEIKIPILLREMGYDAYECETEDMTPDSSVLFEDGSWSITYIGMVICYGESKERTKLFIPSKIGIFFTEDEYHQTSWNPDLSFIR